MMNKQTKNKLEALYWERYIDLLSITNEDANEEIINDGLVFLDDFLTSMDNYINKHWETRALPRKQANRLKEIIQELRECALYDNDEKRAYELLSFSNCLTHIPNNHTNSYYADAYENRIGPLLRDEHIDLIDKNDASYETMQYIIEIVREYYAFENGLLQTILYESNEDYYEIFLNIYLTNLHSVEALNGIISDCPEILNDSKSYSRILAILELKLAVYNYNRFLAHDTNILMRCVMDDYQKTINYYFPKDVVRAMRNSHEKEKVKSLYEKIK